MKKRRMIHETGQSGFTFVETLAVLAIGAVLSAGVGVSAVKAVDHAKVVAAKQAVAQYKLALQSYYVDCGMFPTSQQGLEALWEKPSLVPIPKNWNGPYVDRKIQSDPWGTEFFYAAGGSAQVPAGLPYAIVSYGADGVEGGAGKNEDICSWK